MRIIILAAFTWFAACGTSWATDAAADFVVKLFTNVCIPNIGQPANVRAWVEQQHLASLTDPTALEVFVGRGDKGAAWAVPANAGSFALSIRGTTEACAVWARNADPSEVQSSFERIVEGVKRPGIDVKIEQDTRSPSKVGEAHSLIYSVTGPSRTSGFLFTLLTAEHTGGAFQASIQVAVGKRP